MPSSPDAVRRSVSGIAPADETERAHRRDALAWLAGTADIEAADPARFDPHLGRFIAKVRSLAPPPAGERPGTRG
jgi:hypothetical protein